MHVVVTARLFSTRPSLGSARHIARVTHISDPRLVRCPFVSEYLVMDVAHTMAHSIRRLVEHNFQANFRGGIKNYLVWLRVRWRPMIIWNVLHTCHRLYFVIKTSSNCSSVASRESVALKQAQEGISVLVESAKTVACC